MKVIVVVVFTILEGVRGQQNNAQVQAGDNAEQFALLCRIYNVANNPPIHHVDLLHPHKIVNGIDAINSSFAEEKQFNETEESGNSSDPTLKHTTTREVAVAQAILRRITQKAHSILDDIRRVNITRDIEKVKTEFDQVIFGEGMNESDLCDGVLKDVGERGNACGKPGERTKGTYAGKNLVVDFFCLCAQRTESNEGINEVCNVLVGSNSRNGKHGWETKCPTTSSTMWASVKKGCGRLIHQHQQSTEEGDEAIRDFLKHLKTGGIYRWGKSNNIDGSDRKAGMLGTGVVSKEEGYGKGPVCDGSRGKNGGATVKTGGVCVYYGPSPEWENIDWLKQFRTALNSTHTLNNQTSTIQRDIDKLEMLLHRAEKIYESAKVIAEVQNPVIPTNLQTAAKRLTAYNSALRLRPINHFILLWVLFL